MSWTSRRRWIVVSVVVCGCAQRHPKFAATGPVAAEPTPEPAAETGGESTPRADPPTPAPAATAIAGSPATATSPLCAMVGTVIASLPSMNALHVGEEHAYTSGGRFWSTALRGPGDDDETGTVEQRNLRTPPQFSVAIDSSEPADRALAGAVAELKACRALAGASFEAADHEGDDGVDDTFTWSGERPRFDVERRFDVELRFDDGIVLQVDQWGVL